MQTTGSPSIRDPLFCITMITIIIVATIIIIAMIVSTVIMIWIILCCVAAIHPLPLARRSVIELGPATATTPKTTRLERTALGGGFGWFGV